MIGNYPAGNILLSSAICFAGATAAKVLRVFQHLKLASTTMRTFLLHQSQFLQPVVEYVLSRHQTAMLEECCSQGGVLNVGGDGKADTPGHSAKYGTYTLMDLDNNLIVDTQLVQVIINDNNN